jgi:16S rRNA (uracil1498-N3)-methyltransferase
MGYFLSDKPLTLGAVVDLDGRDTDHIRRSRRFRAGDTFELQDPQGHRFQVVWEPGPSRKPRVRVVAPAAAAPAAPLRLTVLQAALKDKAAENIIRQVTELGVAALVFFQAENSPTALRDLQVPNERWERIAWEACKQSGRALPPICTVAESLAPALDVLDLSPAAPRWMLAPDAEDSPAAAWGGHAGSPPGEAVLLVGPEGGLTGEETACARNRGFRPVRLGGPVLRADTAALAGAALMLHGPWEP